MTELALATGRQLLAAVNVRVNRNVWRVLLVAFVAALAFGLGDAGPVVLAAMRDAFLQVTVFVGATLAAVYAVETAFAVNIGEILGRTRRWQALFAAILGALPGCGGAIIVVTQFARGYISFGSVVSVLIATMGDAAFLLLAREPVTALGVMGVSLLLGWGSGLLIDAVHGTDFLRGTATDAACPTFLAGERPSGRAHAGRRLVNRLWLILVAPGLVVGILGALQIDIDALLGTFGEAYAPGFWLGVAGAATCLLMWALALRTKVDPISCPWLRSQMTVSERVIADTNFVTSWVVLGFLAYGLAVHFAGSGIEHWLKVWAPVVPLVAILIGFIPGCGPQIVVTSLYLTGAIPLSAQLGNAIANDGDALFPALALAPRAALLATIYSAIPAFMLAYGYYLLFE